MIKPNKLLDATLEYKCHKCGMEHWISLDEAQCPGFRFVCAMCKAVNELMPVKVKITITPINVVIPTTKQTAKSNNNTNKNIDNTIDKAVKIVCSYDYKKKEAQSLVDEAFQKLIQQNKQQTVANLVQEAFVHAQ